MRTWHIRHLEVAAARPESRHASLVVAAVIAVIAACSSGVPPAPTPAPVANAPFPAMFDLSLVPDRPKITWPNPGTGIREDLALSTGKADPLPADGSWFPTIQDIVTADTAEPDTNDARFYYSAGVAALHHDPASASAAFYWASRLSPAWAEPYFARWYTLRHAPYLTQMQAVNGRLVRSYVVQGARASTGKPAGPLMLPDSIRSQIDSLFLQANVRDPFVDERVYLDDVEGEMVNATARANYAGLRETERLNYERMTHGEAPLKAPRTELAHTWFTAFIGHDFAGAQRMLIPVINKYPDSLELYLYRAKAQFYLKQYDSSTTTLRAAITRIESKEAARTLPVYFSKAMFIYAVATAQQASGNDTAARTAYQETLDQNLGFYMAHVQLASSAFHANDTATALTEALTATQIRPDDPVVQLFAGYSLLTAGRGDEAVKHMRAAIHADPYYAAAYLYLGEALRQLHDTADAIAAYSDFLAHARRRDPERPAAQAALNALTAAGRN